MKKAIALLLALLVLCAGTALAAEWRPEQPYPGVPEIDLTQSLGYVMFAPNEALAAELACQYLYVYLPRTDVVAGEGLLRVYGDGGELWNTPMNGDAVTLRPMRDNEMALYQWQSGLCFEIKLARTLPLNESCYVNLDPNCIVVPDLELGNKAISSPDEWPILVSGDYGVGSMTYQRDGKTVSTPVAGDTIHFDLTLGGNAAMAALYSPDASVSFSINSYAESCKVTGEVTGDAPTWGVLFLDANNNELARVMFD